MADGIGSPWPVIIKRIERAVPVLEETGNRLGPTERPSIFSRCIRQFARSPLLGAV